MSEKKDDQTISWKFYNDGGYMSEVVIHVKDKMVEIWVEDNYYAFNIPFDTFLAIAKKIKQNLIDTSIGIGNLEEEE